MYEHILVPVAPDSADAGAQSMEVAKRMMAGNGKISVLSILEAVPAYIDTYLPENYLQKNAAELSGRLKAEFESDGAEVHVISGHSGATILEWAKEHGVDCIVMASHRPGFSDLFIGSTAAKVVRHATCTVVVIR